MRNLRTTRIRRDRGTATLESLESRTVMNYTPLGASLPDLVVRGSVPPVAAYGGTITVQADVSNIGHSSLVEPLALEPGAISKADAQPSTLGVYLSANPRRITRGAVKIGEIDVPLIRQNSTLNITETLDMPLTRPRGLPRNGRDLFVIFRANDDRSVLEIDKSNNVSRGSQPVRLAAFLPELSVEAMDVPAFLSPGDAISPTFRIANLGTAATDLQAPVTVQLVASTDAFFGPTDIILATYTIPNIPPLAQAPAAGQTVLGNVTLDPQPNTRTVGGETVILPTEPGSYFIGLIVDPLQQIRQIRDIEGPRVPILEQLRIVGPSTHGLQPANEAVTPSPATNDFQTPAYGLITSPFFPPSATGEDASVTFTTRAVTRTQGTPTRGTTYRGSTANRPGRGSLVGVGRQVEKPL